MRKFIYILETDKVKHRDDNLILLRYFVVQAISVPEILDSKPGTYFFNISMKINLVKDKRLKLK